MLMLSRSGNFYDFSLVVNRHSNRPGDGDIICRMGGYVECEKVKRWAGRFVPFGHWLAADFGSNAGKLGIFFMNLVRNRFNDVRWKSWITRHISLAFAKTRGDQGWLSLDNPVVEPRYRRLQEGYQPGGEPRCLFLLQPPEQVLVLPV